MAVQGLTPARMSKHGYHIPTAVCQYVDELVGLGIELMGGCVCLPSLDVRPTTRDDAAIEKHWKVEEHNSEDDCTCEHAR